MLKLLPSTIWLYHYVIEPCLKRGGRGWLYLPITYLAQRPGAPSRSALQRAVNQLADREEVFGLELSLLWKDGRPQLLVASQDWLKYDRRASISGTKSGPKSAIYVLVAGPATSLILMRKKLLTVSIMHPNPLLFLKKQQQLTTRQAPFKIYRRASRLRLVPMRNPVVVIEIRGSKNWRGTWLACCVSVTAGRAPALTGTGLTAWSSSCWPKGENGTGF